MVGHNDLCDQPFPAQSTLVPSRGEQETPNTITALIQQGYMNLSSQAVMSQVCTSAKKPIFPKNSPSCSSGRCGRTGWKAKEAVPPLTIQLHLMLASKIPHMHWFHSMLYCVYVLRTAVSHRCCWDAFDNQAAASTKNWHKLVFEVEYHLLNEQDMHRPSVQSLFQS